MKGTIASENLLEKPAIRLGITKTLWDTHLQVSVPVGSLSGTVAFAPTELVMI